MSELLPCPFCGNEALLLGGGEYEGIQQGYTVECHNCSATTAYFGADNMQEAIEAWNTRAEQDTAGYQLLMTRCAVLTNLLRDMFPLLNKDLLDEKDRAMLVSCNDRYLALVEGSE